MVPTVIRLYGYMVLRLYMTIMVLRLYMLYMLDMFYMLYMLYMFYGCTWSVVAHGYMVTKSTHHYI